MSHHEGVDKQLADDALLLGDDALLLADDALLQAHARWAGVTAWSGATMHRQLTWPVWHHQTQARMGRHR